jgi:precorrin-6B methylase 1
MKILSDDEETIVVVEVVPDPVAVQLAIVRIQVNIRHVQVAIGVLP